MGFSGFSVNLRNTPHHCLSHVAMGNKKNKLSGASPQLGGGFYLVFIQHFQIDQFPLVVHGLDLQFCTIGVSAGMNVANVPPFR